MIDADAGIALDHAQRFPASHIHDGDEVDPRHDAVGRPMMAPVMDGEILYLRAPARSGVLVLDRVAAGNGNLAGVLIGPAESVEEDMPFGWPLPLLPERA